MICALFGHHDCPSSIKIMLLKKIEEQIMLGVDTFYVGNNGNFDTIALSLLRQLKQVYSHINYAVVLAYLPTNLKNYALAETLFPEGIETVPKRFAIDYRNRWIVSNSDIVICYINSHLSSADKYVQYAKNKGKEVINIAIN